ncbi:hypothetical protein [Collinsella vaginalis]|uniref:hypothetical protein n=1 Tax=Collinsella vaginalis TaxID=1870987 RepID=UPI000A267630|nr:hypothetical protein [Collinsella vaginalis]
MRKKQRNKLRRAQTATPDRDSRHASEAPRKRVRAQRGPGTEEFKHEQSIKTAKWNRYLLIRYLAAGLFFVGLYWAFMLLVLSPGPALIAPALELVTALVVTVEVFTVISRDVEYLVWSHRVLVVSCAVSALAAVATVATGPELLFPFFSAAWVGAALCLALIVIKLIIIGCILRVRDRRDKRYALYQQAIKYN